MHVCGPNPSRTREHVCGHDPSRPMRTCVEPQGVGVDSTLFRVAGDGSAAPPLVPAKSTADEAAHRTVLKLTSDVLLEGRVEAVLRWTKCAKLWGKGCSADWAGAERKLQLCRPLNGSAAVTLYEFRGEGIVRVGSLKNRDDKQPIL
eukprot:364906-Chlamydomonas_euryale.AAC.17